MAMAAATTAEGTTTTLTAGAVAAAPTTTTTTTTTTAATFLHSQSLKYPPNPQPKAIVWLDAKSSLENNSS